MRAHLVLKPASGNLEHKAAIPTAATIKGFQASDETIQKAESAARRLGFKVVSVSPLQVTIEGPKEQFEKAFSSRLKASVPAGQSSSVRRTRPNKASMKKSQTGAWEWESTPELPAEMAEAVTEIILPQAIALH